MDDSDVVSGVLQDPRRPSFLILPIVIAISGIAALLLGTGGVNLAGSETLAFENSELSLVLLEGESTSDPADGWNRYPATVAAVLTESSVLADGQGGAHIADLNEEGSKAALVTTGTDVAVLWIGINDIAEANNPAVVYDQMSTWIATRRSEGWEHVLVLTVPKFESEISLSDSSWGSHELADNARQQLNELIALNQGGADAVVDLRKVAGIGDEFSVEDPQWRSDKMHFTPEGYEKVASRLLGALSKL